MRKITKIKLLQKGELKSKLSFLVLHHNPELTIHNDQWTEAYNWYKGYCACFESVVGYPFDDSYAHNFILEETFKYLLSIIE